MIKNKTVLAIIPARGGSKGVVHKNIRSIAGKPLIAWTILEAKKSKYLDRIILSSENSKIIAIAKQYRCEVPFIRPKKFARDNSPASDVILHTLKQVSQYDYFVFLQPTSPLRSVEDIDKSIALCIGKRKPACISLTEAGRSPFWMYTLSKKKMIKPVLQPRKNMAARQLLPKVYAINGAVYVAKTNWFRAKKTFISRGTLSYVMPPERSIDIDTELDLKLCDFLLKKKKRVTKL